MVNFQHMPKPAAVASALACLVAGALLVGATRSERPAQTSKVVALVHVNVIPMDRERVLVGRTIIVRDGIITTISAADSVVVPADAQVFHGGDSVYVIPGLSDMHVHLRYESDLMLLLANGVTTVRNMRGTPWHLQMRKQVAQGERIGPRIFTAGPILYGFRGAGSTAAEARALVDSQATAGYDFVKVYDRLPRSSYDAVVAEAGVKRLPVAGHIVSGATYGSGLDEALAARQASIEHAEQFVYHFFGNDLDRSRIPLMASRVKAAGTTLVPTLVVVPALADQWDKHDSVMKRPEMRFVHPETYAWWRGDRGHASAINHVLMPFLDDIVRGLRDAQVPLMAGTDFYIFGTVAGFSLHDELAALVHAGLTPYEALAAATSTPAAYLGDSAHSGTVAVGKRADLVILRGNPLVNIHNSTRILGVVAAGRLFEHAELGRMLDSLASAFAFQHRFVDDVTVRGAASMLLRQPSARDPVAESTLNQLATDLARAKRWPDAVAVGEFGVRARPTSRDAWLLLSSVALQKADTASAAAVIARGLARIPGDSVLLRTRAGLLHSH